MNCAASRAPSTRSAAFSTTTRCCRIEQWDELVRLAALLRDRLTPAHVVMQRLINAPAADRLAGESPSATLCRPANPN